MTTSTSLPRYGESRQLPWSVMGGNLKPEHTTDYLGALNEKGLNYDIALRPAGFLHTEPAGQFPDFERWSSAPGNFAITRPMVGYPMALAYCGKRYTPIQNRDAFSVGGYLVSEFGATVDAVADFRHGHATLMALKLDGASITLDTPGGTRDVTDLYLVMINVHDGSGALSFNLTPVRVACTNAVTASLRGARTWRVSHTPNASSRIELANDAILRSVSYQEALEEAAQRMVDTPCSAVEFDKITHRLWPSPATHGGKETLAAQKAAAVRAQAMHLFTHSPNLDAVRGTRWAAYNALVEWADHYRPVGHARRPAEGQEATMLRAGTAFEGRVQSFKDRVGKILIPG